MSVCCFFFFEHRFLRRESESIYLHKVDHPVHSFLEQFHALFHPRAVCVETSDVGVCPYRQVVGVHGQHYLSFHCRVHVVDHDVEQRGEGSGGGGGAITDPSGMPILTPLVVDVAPFHLTCIDLSLRKDLMKLYMLPEIPILLSFCSSLACQT